MSKYEMDTYLTKPERFLLYVFFVLCVVVTVILYRSIGEVWLSQLALYGTGGMFILAVLAWMNARIVKKYNRNIDRITDEAVEAVRHLTTPPVLGEARYAHQGKVVPLADALGNDI